MSGLHTIFIKTDSQAKIMAAADTLLTNTTFDFLQVSGGQIGYQSQNVIQARMDQVRSRVNDSLSEVNNIQGVNYYDTCIATYFFSSLSPCSDAPVLVATSSSGCNDDTEEACHTYLSELRMNSGSCETESKHICAVLQYSEDGISKNLIVSKRPTFKQSSIALASASAATTFYAAVGSLNGESGGTGSPDNSGNGDGTNEGPLGNPDPTCLNCPSTPPFGSPDGLEPEPMGNPDPMGPDDGLGDVGNGEGSSDSGSTVDNLDGESVFENSAGLANEGNGSHMWFD
jgi:hypothetical protein